MARRRAVDEADLGRQGPAARAPGWAPARGTSDRGLACRLGEPCDREMLLDPARVALVPAGVAGSYRLDVTEGRPRAMEHKVVVLELCAGHRAELAGRILAPAGGA